MLAEALRLEREGHRILKAQHRQPRAVRVRGARGHPRRRRRGAPHGAGLQRQQGPGRRPARRRPARAGARHPGHRRRRRVPRQRRQRA
nr:hypothetical protein [Angustibacter aerolatus]